MRAKIKFPHKQAPVEREVRKKPYGTYYIRSKGKDVTVVPAGKDLFEISPTWRGLYGGQGVDA